MLSVRSFQKTRTRIWVFKEIGGPFLTCGWSDGLAGSKLIERLKNSNLPLVQKRLVLLQRVLLGEGLRFGLWI